MEIKIFKRKNNFKKKDYELNPNPYWKIALGIMAVAILTAAFFGFGLFLDISKDPEVLSVSDTGKAPRVKEDRLKKALDYFSQKEKKSKEILNSPAPVVDPSL